MATLVIPGRFNGPPESANGGYAAGLVAGWVGGSAEVTPEVALRSPPPLATPLTVAGDSAQVQVFDGDRLVAEAFATTIHDVAPPVAVSPEEAERASAAYVGFDHHEFATCFVCGPRRPAGDGLGIFPGRVQGTEVVAAPWVPSDEFADEDGAVAEPVMWAALDCPSYFGGGGAERSLLGRIAVDLRSPVRAGEQYVVLGWGTGSDGRKHFAASALLDGSGEVVAAARALWIEPRRD